MAIARHSETKEPMVVYKALYNDETYGDEAIWLRPAAMWNETVPAPATAIDVTTTANGADDKNGKANALNALNGKEVKRFTRV